MKNVDGYRDLARRLMNADRADGKRDNHVKLSHPGAQRALFKGLDPKALKPARADLIDQLDALDHNRDGLVSLAFVDAPLRDHVRLALPSLSEWRATAMKELEAQIAAKAQAAKNGKADRQLGKLLDPVVAPDPRAPMVRAKGRLEHHFVRKLSDAEQKRDQSTKVALLVSRIDLTPTDIASVPGVLEDAEVVELLQLMEAREPSLPATAKATLTKLAPAAAAARQQAAKVDRLHGQLAKRMRRDMAEHLDNPALFTNTVGQGAALSTAGTIQLQLEVGKWQGADSVVYGALKYGRGWGQADTGRSQALLAQAHADRADYLEGAEATVRSALAKARPGSVEHVLLQDALTYRPYKIAGAPDQPLREVVQAATDTARRYADR